MRLEDDLPGSAACAPDHAPWQIPADWTDPECVLTAADLHNELLSAASQNGDFRLEQASAAALADLDALERREPLPAAALRLGLGAGLAEFWNGRGDAGRAWEWTATAVGRVLRNPVRLEYDPVLPVLLLRTPSTAPAAALGLLSLADSLYYLAWSRGYLPELARGLEPVVEPLLQAAVPAGEALSAAGHFASWLRTNQQDDRARAVVAALEARLYQDPDGPSAPLLANLLTSGLGTLSSRTPVDHFDWAMAHVSDPDPLTRLGWLSALPMSGPAAVVDRYEVVRSAVADGAATLHGAGMDPLRTGTALTQYFKSVVPLVASLLEAGETSRAVALAATWMGVSDGETAPDALFVFEDATGVRLALPGSAPFVLSTSGRSRATSAANAALGKALVDAQSPASPNASATGKVDGGHGAEFGSAIDEYLGAERLSAAISHASAAGPLPPLVNLLSGHVPVQGVLARAGAPVPALLASLARPRPDRHVSRIRFWTGDVSGAVEELESVRSVLGGFGIVVDEVPVQAATRDRFLTEYADDRFDVLWVASHADRDLYDPEEAGLTLRSGERVTLRDLTAVPRPQGNRRRLLVLNGCSSGAVSDYGPLSRLGLAHALAAPDQAVVANLWPVDSGPSRVFAALLAAGISQFPAFTEAYEWAARIFAGPADATASALKEWDGSGRSLDAWHASSPASVLAWGAPALFV